MFASRKSPAWIDSPGGRPCRQVFGGWALLVCLTTPWICGVDGAEPRPNIVYILADDFGYGDLGSYGQRMIATPHLDALARAGVRFTQHYAGNAVCTPSRSSLLTGRHTGRTVHRDNPRFVNSYGFPPGELTFADVLRGAGYATGIAGKWHVGDRADSRDMAHHHGFDFAYCVGYPYPDQGIEHWPSHLFTNGAKTPIPENAAARPGRYMDDLYTEAALRFIAEPRAKPFLLYLALQSPHAPIDGAISPTYADRPWPEVEKKFASMVERIDENVGRVLAALDRLGLADNTVVFFTSDNGPHREGGHDPEFFRSGGLLRGGKRDLYEGGVRVPLLVRWPGVVAPHTTNDHVSAFWDILPTFAEIGGATPPAGLDGKSFVPALRGRPQPAPEYLYWEMTEGGGKQAVRAGDWKAVRVGVRKDAAVPFELYNLKSDPGELHNLAADNLEVVRRLAGFAAAAHTPSPRAPLFPHEPAAPAPTEWRALLDLTLSQWEGFLGVPHGSLGLPGVPADSDGAKGTPLGLGREDLGVFTVATEGGEPVLRVNGKIYGALTTKESFSNYHMRFQFKWGDAKWEPRLTKRRDNGLLYHAAGPHGAFWNTWKRSLEFQIEETHVGAFYGLGGATAEVPVVADGKVWRYAPTGTPARIGTAGGSAYYTARRLAGDVERPHGEWNTLELFTLGRTAVHVVNGRVVLVARNAVTLAADGRETPLTGGQLQLQSEGAETFFRRVELRPITAWPAEYREQLPPDLR